MKDKTHIKSFNEATENLNISDVRSNKTNSHLNSTYLSILKQNHPNE